MGRWQDKAAWHRRARRQLQCEPLCAMCLSEGRIVAARIADHVEPHQGDPVKFWSGKLQSLCAHWSRTKFAEHRGFVSAISFGSYLCLSPRPKPALQVQRYLNLATLLQGPAPRLRVKRAGHQSLSLCL